LKTQPGLFLKALKCDGFHVAIDAGINLSRRNWIAEFH
jgi:hypothetical protein